MRNFKIKIISLICSALIWGILFMTDSAIARRIRVTTLESSSQIKIEMVTPDDWEDIKDEIMAIEEEAFPEPELFQDEEDLEATFLDGNSICLVARDGDRIIGYVIGGPLEDYDDLPGVGEEEDITFGQENTIYLESRAVLEEYQGQGIGSKLREEFLWRARERGCKFVTGHIREDYIPEGAEIVSTWEDYLDTGETFVYYRITL